MGRPPPSRQKNWSRGDPRFQRGNPPVSGLLTVTLNSANRLLKWLTDVDKVYVGVMRLHAEVDLAKLRATMKEFETTIYQTPPMKSAVKRRTRKRQIYSFTPIEVDGKYVLFRAHVESGTYIRKLCFDLGETLGIGINMVELRRIRSGTFDESSMVTLNQLAYSSMLYYNTNDPSGLNRILKPVETILEDKSIIVVKESAKKNLYNGAPLSVRGIVCMSRKIKKDSEAFICTQQGELIEVARVLSDPTSLAQMEHGVVATPVRVLEPLATQSSAGVS